MSGIPEEVEILDKSKFPKEFIFPKISTTRLLLRIALMNNEDLTILYLCLMITITKIIIKKNFY